MCFFRNGIGLFSFVVAIKTQQDADNGVQDDDFAVPFSYAVLAMMSCCLLVDLWPLVEVLEGATHFLTKRHQELKRRTACRIARDELHREHEVDDGVLCVDPEAGDDARDELDPEAGDDWRFWKLVTSDNVDSPPESPPELSARPDRGLSHTRAQSETSLPRPSLDAVRLETEVVSLENATLTQLPQEEAEIDCDGDEDTDEVRFLFL
jgi:hypothetical protein